MPVTTTSNSSNLLTPVTKGARRMPWTPAQNRLFHVAAAGKSKEMSASTAKKILAKEDYKVKAKVKGQQKALSEGSK